MGLYCTTPGVAVSRSVPAKTAFRMLATGRPITATEALTQGLISHVTQEDSEKALDDLIAEITGDITGSGSQVSHENSPKFHRNSTMIIFHRPHLRANKSCKIAGYKQKLIFCPFLRCRWMTLFLDSRIG